VSERLGDGPVQEQYREKMIAVVKALDETFNGADRGQDRKTGFILLVFPFGSHEGRCNYMSNGADRRDVICMLKEQLARFEGQAEMKGTA
jgi:hypothetical protein